MCFHKIKEIFGKSKLAAPPEGEAIKEKPPRKWWQFPFRVLQASRGGPNMPKYQPCAQCHASSKRQEKTLGGANYLCRQRHGKFFVKA